MDRQAEIIDLRRTIAAQETWGKFSVRNHNRLAELEAEERVERWGFDWVVTFTGIWGYLSPIICAMMNHK